MSALATAALVLGLLSPQSGTEKGSVEATDAPAKVELRMRTTTSVRGLDVTLADLCDITPLDATGIALGDLRFSQSPVNGHARSVGRTEIVQAIAAAGRDLASVKLTGADEVVVQAIVAEIPAGEFVDVATTALQAVLATEGGDVEFEPPTQLRIVQAPPGRRSQELSARVRGGATGPNSAVVDVDVLVDGASFRKIPVTFKLTRFQNVLRTIAPVRAGTPLGPDNLALVREAMAQANGAFINNMVQVDGMVASRDLTSKQRLMLSDFAPPALIHKGDIVTVVMTNGRVKVTTKAIANHDAALGARITLTNATSRSLITGMVAQAGLVIVQQ